MPAPSERLRSALVALLVLGTACGSPKKKPDEADAALAVDTAATSYLFAGEQVPRAVHWTRAGDVVGMSSGALWRLPGGEVGPGAQIVDTQLPEVHGTGHKRTLISVYDTQTGSDRWVLGGEGFLSVRDPKTLAEIRRVDVGGNVSRLVLAKNADVALVYSCPDYCNVTRVHLDTGAQAILGRITSEEPLVVSPDGGTAVFSRDNQLMVFQGDAFQPVFTAAGGVGTDSGAAVFQPDGSVLFGAGREVGRWDPKTGKATTAKLPIASENQTFMTADPALGRIIGSLAYGGDVAIYDGVTVKVVPVPDPGCGSARAAIDDPTQIECTQLGTRVDAAGVALRRPLGPVVRASEKHALRTHSTGCEVVERATGRIVTADDHGLCGATFSPDGTRLAWVADDGTVQVQGVAAGIGDTSENRMFPGGVVEGGTWVARWEDAVVSFGPAGFVKTPLPTFYRAQPELGPQAMFRIDNQRVVGVDGAGKEHLRAVDMSWGQDGENGYRQLFVSGTSAVTNSYGHEVKATVCRLDAGCTEIEIGPATAVKSYEAPWIVTSVFGEPDAPEQTVYYLRHDDAREPLRRVIVGRECAPVLLTEHGDKLVCVSDDKMVVFDTKTGQPLGGGLPVDLDRSLPPSQETSPFDSRRRNVQGRSSSDVIGHSDTSVFLRTGWWLYRAFHVEERVLPAAGGDAAAPDAGAAPAAIRSVAALGPSFAIVRNADGAVRIGGDVARAERSLACRRGNDLLPWSVCKAAALRPAL